MLKRLFQFFALFLLLPSSIKATHDNKKRKREKHQTQLYDQRKKQKLQDLHHNLLTAIENGTREIVIQLLAQGANPNQKDFETLTTPLHHAAKKGLNDIISILLNAKADLHAKNRIGATALHFAVREDNISTVKLLIEKGVRLEDKSWGFTPLHQSTNKEITKVLLDAGANPLATDDNNQTPLHHTTYAGRLFQTIILLSHTHFFLTNHTDTMSLKNNANAFKNEYLNYIKNVCSIRNNQNMTALDMAKEQLINFPQRNSYKKLINLFLTINMAKTFNMLPDKIKMDVSKTIHNFITIIDSENSAEPMEIE